MGRLRHPACRALARLLLFIAVAAFAVQPPAMARMIGEPHASHMAGPSPAPSPNADIHDCDGGHAAPAPIDSAPHRHGGACLSLCCLAPLPAFAAAEAAHDWRPLARAAAAERPLLDRRTPPDPPPPRFS